MAIFSAGIGLIRPSISAAVSKRTDSAQGTAMGILNGYDSLGRTIGPALGGFMLDRGLNLGYYTAIVVAVLAFADPYHRDSHKKISKGNSLKTNMKGKAVIVLSLFYFRGVNLFNCHKYS